MGSITGGSEDSTGAGEEGGADVIPDVIGNGKSGWTFEGKKVIASGALVSTPGALVWVSGGNIMDFAAEAWKKLLAIKKRRAQG